MPQLNTIHATLSVGIICATLIILLAFVLKRRGITLSKGTLHITEGQEIDSGNLVCISKERISLIAQEVEELVKQKVRLQREILRDQMTMAERRISLMTNNMSSVARRAGLDAPLVFGRIERELVDAVRHFSKVNHFTDRDEKGWTEYIKQQRNYLLPIIASVIADHCDHDFEELINGELVRIYDGMIYELFHELRAIAYQKELRIKEIEDELKCVKLGKRL